MKEILQQTSHEALRTDDILEAIFSYLSPPLNAPGPLLPRERQTLLHAALVCRAFSPHALNALWRVMFSLVPLIKLIPGIVTFRGAQTQSHVWYLDTPLTTHDMRAFKQYSSRIEAYHDHFPPILIPTPVLLDILHYSERQHLLPNLLSLRIHAPIADHHYGLISPKLQQIAVHSNYPNILQQLVSHLSWATPNLTELEIESRSPIACEILGRLASLRVVKLPSKQTLIINPESFHEDVPFANRIHTLYVGAIRLPQDWTKKLAGGTTAKCIGGSGRKAVQFPILTRLVLTDATGMHFLPELLELHILPDLHDLTITLSRTVNFAVATALFSALFGGRRRTSSLRSVILHRDSVNISTPNEIHMSELLEGAAPQPNLHTFHVTITLLSSFTLPSIRALGATLPRLQDLYLQLPSDGLITLDALSELTRLLSCLLTLTIGIDATDADAIIAHDQPAGESDDGARAQADTPSTRDADRHPLTKLCLTALKTNNPVDFARHVFRKYPMATITQPPVVFVKDLDKVCAAHKVMKNGNPDELDAADS